MTADARQQAEQIVERVVGLAATHSIGAGGDGDVAAEYVGDVKRALAAAIEETEAENAFDALRNSARQHGKIAAVQRLDVARIDRREALSALGVEVDGG